MNVEPDLSAMNDIMGWNVFSDIRLAIYYVLGSDRGNDAQCADGDFGVRDCWDWRNGAAGWPSVLPGSRSCAGSR